MLQKMSLDADRKAFLLNPIQKFTDNQLLLELVRRGYDFSSTQENDNITAEIIKIGVS